MFTLKTTEYYGHHTMCNIFVTTIFSQINDLLYYIIISMLHLRSHHGLPFGEMVVKREHIISIKIIEPTIMRPNQRLKSSG